MKLIGPIIALSLALIGGFIGYGQLQANQENTEEKVEEVKKEVKEHDEQINTLENFSIKQTVLIERAIKSLEKLEEKLEK